MTTPNDFVVDDAWYAGRAQALRPVVTLVKERMNRQSFEPQSSALRKTVDMLFDLSLFYLDEMDRCLTGVAFFAANVMGASALESILVMLALRERTRVEQTKKWQTIQKNDPGKDFHTLLASNRVGLKTLVVIAQELQWLPAHGFSAQFRSKMVEMVGEENIRKVEVGLPGLSVSLLATIVSTGVRNAVHPGRVIIQPLGDVKFMGALSAMFCVIALGIVVDHSAI